MLKALRFICVKKSLSYPAVDILLLQKTNEAMVVEDRWSAKPIG
jgi:hypothetical protein